MSSPIRLTVAHRLGLGYGLVLLLSTAIALLGGWGLTRVNASLQSVFAESTVPLQRLAKLRDHTARERILLTDAILQGQAEIATQRVAQHQRSRGVARKAWNDFVSASTDEVAAGAPATGTERALKALQTQGFDATAGELAAGRFDAARRLLDEQVATLYPAFSEALDDLVAAQVDAAEEHFNAAQNLGEQLSLALAALAGVGLLIGTGAAFGVTRHLVRSLGAEPAALAAVAEQIARGDIVQEAHESAPAPAGSVMASMRRMRASLVEVVGSVRSGVDGVAGASAQIVRGNHDLASRTDAQAGNLQRTTSAMAQLTGTVNANADAARRANELALAASAVAVRGGQAVAEVVTTMAQIREASAKIADITGFIDGIAFQTNLLALNAAVEAARAGGAGKGFAVVAGEVRMLAQRSASASRQIKALVDDSVKRVSAGSSQVAAAGQTMGDIVTQVHQVSSLIGEITTASQEQSLGIAQVGQAMGQLDQTTRQNAAMAQDSTLAAEGLKTQAALLSNAVALFRLEHRAA